MLSSQRMGIASLNQVSFIAAVLLVLWSGIGLLIQANQVAIAQHFSERMHYLELFAKAYGYLGLILLSLVFASFLANAIQRNRGGSP